MQNISIKLIVLALALGFSAGCASPKEETLPDKTGSSNGLAKDLQGERPGAAKSDHDADHTH